MTVNNSHKKKQPISLVEERAADIASQMNLELVEVTLEKESRGKCLCIYVDKQGGLSLDDCEHYHKKLQPLLEDIDYDIMEVSSPGIDRPIKTRRDFERNRDLLVEVRLFAPYQGSKVFHGRLSDMDDSILTIIDEAETAYRFDRKTIALVKPVIELDEDDFSDVIFSEDDASEIEL